jgi:hypothetical protein
MPAPGCRLGAQACDSHRISARESTPLPQPVWPESIGVWGGMNAGTVDGFCSIGTDELKIKGEPELDFTATY